MLLLDASAILGFGSQGEAQALNLRDSGVEVLIGLPPQSRSRERAAQLGFEVVSTQEATQRSTVIALALPDLKIGSIFAEQILPKLQAGKTLLFLHGFAITYEHVVPPREVNTILVAPKGPGAALRKKYLSGEGLPAALGVAHDATGRALEVARQWARALGCHQEKMFLTSFREETECDLFGEQAVLCGGVSALIEAAFETLVEAGYRPEMAFIEVCYELQLTVDLIAQHGVAGMRERISETASYGDISVGPTIINDDVRCNMRAALEHIRSGAFAQEWQEQYETHGEAYQHYRAILAGGKKTLLHKVSKIFRDDSRAKSH